MHVGPGVARRGGGESDALLLWIQQEAREKPELNDPKVRSHD
jgi:hypothetical protein